MRALLLCIVALLVAGCSVRQAGEAEPAAAQWEVTPDLQVEVLVPGVWRHVSWQVLDSGLRYPSNGLLVRDGDGVMMIETAWGEASTEALIEWAETELGLSVTRAYSTHWHDDRLGGAPVLQVHGIPFYAHPLTAEAARANDLPVPTAIAPLAPGETTALGPVEVLYPGPGHTPDNTMVWVPSARVLVGGCAVRSAASRGMGYTGDADVEQWPEAMTRALETFPDAQVVLPGHGDPGDLGLLRHTRALLAAE